MIAVYIGSIKELEQKEIDSILASLSDSAYVRVNEKRNKTLRTSSVCALSLIPREMRQDLDYTENGRPFFKTLDADISISHSKKYAAVAISTSNRVRVGIDVEDVNREKGDNSLLRFFTENECSALENGTSEIEIWTKKEALFKHLNNDDINFISLDTTATDKSFTTVALDEALLTVCTTQNKEIEFIYN